MSPHFRPRYLLRCFASTPSLLSAQFAICFDLFERWENLLCGKTFSNTPALTHVFRLTYPYRFIGTVLQSVTNCFPRNRLPNFKASLRWKSRWWRNTEARHSKIQVIQRISENEFWKSRNTWKNNIILVISDPLLEPIPLSTVQRREGNTIHENHRPLKELPHTDAEVSPDLNRPCWTRYMMIYYGRSCECGFQALKCKLHFMSLTKRCQFQIRRCHRECLFGQGHFGCDGFI